MPEIVLGLLFIVLLFSFAFYGFVKFVAFLFGTSDSKKSTPKLNDQPKRRSISDDVFGASHLLDYLFQKNKINRPAYDRLRDFLEGEFAGKYKMTKRLKAPTPPVPTVPNKQTSESLDAEIIDDVELVNDAVQSTPVVPPPVGEISQPEVIFQKPASSVDPAPSEAKETPPMDSLGTAPWDLPDPPAPTPRRSFSEIMSGFMLEKNIRWGELASGILIVGSAVGLVVSLRNELRDTIPYFSALLFMLITAAIHGAGIYTLKKWKLRNTSRGTLMIGLLLIPLNLVAACILSGNESDRRELTDPLLWLAIGIGFSAFSAMCWFSNKCLLRKGQLPMVIAMMGCCVSTLLINRTDELSSSSLYQIIASVPIMFSFLVGTAFFYKRQWVRLRWPERASHRVFLFLGMSSFAALAAASMLVVKVEDKSTAFVSLTPLFSTICIMTSWLGRVIWRGGAGVEKKTLQVTGLSLHVLGLGLLVVSVIASFANPTVLLVNSGMVTIGLLVLARHQSEARLLPFAWGSLGAFVLCLVNLSLSRLSWDSWATLSELGNAALSGVSGLSLLAVGLGVIAFHFVLKGKSKSPSTFVAYGIGSGSAIVLAGCTLALFASFVNPENAFDMHTATGLLGVASVMGLVGCVTLSGKTDLAVSGGTGAGQNRIWVLLAFGCGALLLGFLAHGLIWNSFLASRLNEALFDIDANWQFIFVTHAFVLATVSLLSRWNQRRKQSGQPTIADSLGEFSFLSGVLGTAGLFGLIDEQTGVVSGLSMVLIASTLILAWVQPDHRYGARFWVGLFTATTLASVVLCVLELLPNTRWCGEIESSRFVFMMLIATSSWAILAAAASWFASRFDSLRAFASFEPRVESVAVLGLVVLSFGYVGFGLSESSRLELFGDASPARLTLGGDYLVGLIGLLVLALSTVVLSFKRPHLVYGLGMVATWFVAWAFLAEYFNEAKAVGTGIRWILPMGGVVAASLVAMRRPFRPAWAAARNRLGLKGKSSWPAHTTQTLINFSLAFVAVVVLLISTVAIVQVMMKGGVEALGGPLKGTLFGDMKKDVSYGIPVGIMVGTFLLYAISERRKWLATAGSAVFQYCVVLAVILLFLSPHPKLASSWFVNILQAVSIGMTGYGFVWYFFRNRIEGQGTQPAPALTTSGLAQIEVHTLINGFLITSLAALVIGRFYLKPTVSGDWINTVGSLLGIGAWAAFGGLAYTVWKQRLNQPHRTSTWMWLSCWMGLALVSMLAAFLDRTLASGVDAIPWMSFDIIMWGGVCVCLSQVVLLALERRPAWAPRLYSERASLRFHSMRSDQTLPLLFAGMLVTAFAMRGMLNHPSGFWAYFIAFSMLIACLVVAGVMRQSPWLAFISAGLTSMLAITFVNVDPQGWFGSGQPHLVNVTLISLVLLAAVWSGCFVVRTVKFGQVTRPAMVWMSNVVLFLAACWILLGALGECVIEFGGLPVDSLLRNLNGMALTALAVGLCGLHLWNRRRKGWVAAAWMLGFAIMYLIFVSVRIGNDEVRAGAIMLVAGSYAAITGVVWAFRRRWLRHGRQLGMPRMLHIENSMYRQFPIFVFGVGLIIFFFALTATFNAEGRMTRYLAASSPFGIAASFAFLSNARSRRKVQMLALATLTAAAMIFAWADLSPAGIQSQPSRLVIRALLVFAGAMFFYGGFVSRWVQEGDSWLISLREMTVATCLLALFTFFIAIAFQINDFVPEVGCGTSSGEAIAVAAVALGMMVGLVLIAVLPENDPFATSINGRMGYVYAAQLIGALIVVHLYLSMPFLFRFGIKDYWPYVAMVLCFGGVGVAQVLEKRGLTVLGQPLFHTAAILPLAVAACVMGVDSKADAALVMLTVGLAYLMISYVQQSLLAGAAAVLFGNLALWMFYYRLDGFSFMEHPQLWLIPPAVSVLVASQLSRDSFSRKQLATIRYLCVTVIYMSSTSEIFINGMGEKLWPPMVLALLAVGGMMAGILMQIRAYLYLGSLFLLMAMISMVSHAHQRLDHVWPWWAFGIGMGVAILVMFGLFEKRKNDMKEVVGRLKEWEL